MDKEQSPVATRASLYSVAWRDSISANGVGVF